MNGSDSSSVRRAACQTAARAALCTIAGIFASGPLAVLGIQALYPQPQWESPAVYAKHFHFAQTLPYLGGFVLVGGYVVLISSLHVLARPQHRARSTAALVFAATYAALVLLNYATQSMFVPPLARDYEPAFAPLLLAFSMSNPHSLAWTLELWGYAALGVATWFVAPVVSEHGKLGRATAITFASNGVVSLSGAVWPILQPGWAMTAWGFASYALWNVLAFVMSVLAFLALRQSIALQDPEPRDFALGIAVARETRSC